MRIRKLLSDTTGATSIEYAMIATLVSIVAITAMVAIGTSVTNLLSGVMTAF